MFLTFRTICNLVGGLGLWVGWEEGEEESQGSIPAYYEACLRLLKNITSLLTLNNEKRFFSSKRVVFN